MARYMVGDRVEAVCHLAYGNILTGDFGTICEIIYGDRGIGVRWDKEFPEAHSCSGNCEDGHGWYVYPEHIGLYKEEATEDIDEESFLNILL